MAQLNTLVANVTAGTPSTRFLELACKCVRRALETGDYESFAELAEKIETEIKVPEDDESLVESIINERIGYLEKDIVRKQRIRFEALETRVKEMIEQETLNGGNVSLGPRRLRQLISGDDMPATDIKSGPEVELAQALDTPEKEAAKLYAFLWISERFALLGMCRFLDLAQASSQRNGLHVGKQICVYNDILQLDFDKYKQSLEDHVQNDEAERQAFKESNQDDPDAVFVPAVERRSITQLVKIMARSA